MERLLVCVALLPLVQASLNVAPEVFAAAESVIASTDSHNVSRTAQLQGQPNELNLTATKPQAERLAGLTGLHSAVLAHVEATTAKASSSSVPAAATPSDAVVSLTDAQPTTIVAGRASSLRSFGSSGTSLKAEAESADRIVKSVTEGLTGFGAVAGVDSTTKAESGFEAVAAAMTDTTASPSIVGDKPTFRLLHAALLFVVVPLALLLQKAGVIRLPCQVGKARSFEDKARLQRANDWIEAWRASKERDRDMEIMSTA